VRQGKLTSKVLRRRSGRRRIGLAATMAAAAACVLTGAGAAVASDQHSTRTQASGPSQVAPWTGYVDVSVATLWTSPAKPRPRIDAPALTNPVNMQQWLDNMSTAQRLALTTHNATQTQALFGTKVYIIGRRPGWDEIAVTGQPTPKNPLGYPGWVPAIQLTRNPFFAAMQNRPFALVNGAPTVWLYNNSQLTSQYMQISYATRLPVLVHSDKAIEVQTPTQGPKWLRAATSHVYAAASDIPRPTRRQLASDIEMFEGGAYIWGGRSGFMDDCSGLTSLIYQANGMTIPRDANAQAIGGLWKGDPNLGATDTAGLKPGDVMYYANGHGTQTETIYHDAMYVGNGEMVEAYGAGIPIRITAVRTSPSDNYWGAIQFLTSST
jgi:gamma-D-glutamyl-L-lysine dipeptidyl-peptidase